MSGVSASPLCTLLLHSPQSKTQTSLCSCNAFTGVPGSKLQTHSALSFTREQEYLKVALRCNSSTGPDGPASGEGDGKTILDAFFFGRALAEALNERVESAVGEFLSTIGRLQAEQQKQIQEFQEDVFQRAKKAKKQAAQEALEAKGLISKPTTVDTTAVTESVSPASTYTVIPEDADPSITPDTETDADPATKGPAFGVPNDD